VVADNEVIQREVATMIICFIDKGGLCP